MHTVLLSENFPPAIGGSSRWFWEIYRRMPRATTLVIAGQTAAAREFDPMSEVRIVRAPLSLPDWGLASWRGMRGYWSAYRSICRELTLAGVNGRTAMLHAGRCLPEGWLAWLLSRRMGLRYLVYVHGEDVSVARASRQHRYMTAWVLRGAAGVIANSQNTAEMLEEEWTQPRERIHVLHPGVDAERFCPAAPDAALRSQLGWAGRRVVLTVGRLQLRKGHDALIRALDQIRQHVPNVLYVIAGDGEERGALERLVDGLDLRRHVQFLGDLDDERLVGCYRNCDLFVLPNRAVGNDLEGFGMVLLEAQSCGKPVIAGDSGGTRETLIDSVSGRIVDCRRPEVLAGAVSDMLADAERLLAMGQAGRRWIESRFDWPSRFAEAQDVFRAVERKPAVAQDSRVATVMPECVVGVKTP
jgi:phosphatidylinositol alpha-1,6-mannosyltransferase